MARKKNKKKNSKKKDLKKKQLKKKLEKKQEKKKQSKKKNLKKKNLKKKNKEVKVKTVKAVKAAKPALSTGSFADHSSNYNVPDALAKLRTLTSLEQVQVFTKGEARVGITRSIPVVMRRFE